MSVAGPGGPAGPAGDNIVRAIVFMCLAVSLFPVMNATVKVLSAEYPTVQIVWLRYLGHLLFMVLVFAPRRRLRLFATRRPGMQFVRSLLLFSSTSLYFLALSYVPLPTAATINFVGPLLVTALSVPLLGERVGARRWVAVAVGFAGAVIIIRPGFGAVHWAALLLIANAACYALYQILSRKLASHDPAETSITYIAMVGVVVAGVAIPFAWRWPVEPWHWAAFALLGLAGGFGHYFLVRAYQWGPAAVVAPFNYGQLIGATVLSYLLFDDLPDLWTWVGAVVIVASGLYIAYRERRITSSNTTVR